MMASSIAVAILSEARLVVSNQLLNLPMKETKS